jgi:hypothetical protein
MSSMLPSLATAEAQRTMRWSLLVGAFALGVCVLFAFFSPTQFFRAYLASYLFFFGIALGSLVILMIYHLTGGAWGYLVQRLLEAGARTLPFLAILFVPIGLGAGSLYLWAQPDEVAANEGLLHKHIYLNAPFFLARAGLFFILWSALAYVLDYWSRRHDETGDAAYSRWAANLAGPGLIVIGISMTFAAVDWVMSLEPSFRSTIFGPLLVSGQMVSALAAALVALAWLAPRSQVGDVVSNEALGDLGNLLLTFLVVWAYMMWFQFMLIWMANLPWEVAWFLNRSRDGWIAVVWALVVLHFAVPFFMLLMRDVKQHLPSLAKVAGLILFMQLVFNYFLVAPSFPGTNIGQHWMDFLMPLGIGGLWLAYYLWEIQRHRLLPRRDEDRAAALHLRALDAEAATRPQEVTHG